MTVTETELKGCYILQPKVFHDNRGYFLETFNQRLFNELTNTDTIFVQDNESFSTKGVLRGLHYQLGEYAQAKLVRVLKGIVLDVVTDIRKDSKTFGKHIAVELSEDNKTQIFLPRGFAHGFVVLSETAIFSYKCDNYYNKESEGGIIYNDPSLNINWQLPQHEIVVSNKDILLPSFENAIL